MHVEEVDRDRESKDESQRHMESGQRQACMEEWIGADTCTVDDKMLMDGTLSLNLLRQNLFN
jgi:hypothetical protein